MQSEIDADRLTDGEAYTGARLGSEAVARYGDRIHTNRNRKCCEGPGIIGEQVALSAGLLVMDGDVGAGYDSTSHVNDCAADRTTNDLGIIGNCGKQEYEKDNGATEHKSISRDIAGQAHWNV